MLYDGDHRRRMAGCLVEGWNRPDRLRPEKARERELFRLKFIFEDLPQADNRITRDGDGTPRVHFARHHSYAFEGIRHLESRAARFLGALPIEHIVWDLEPEPTESHILGTTVMGLDPASSVVDPDCVHHVMRNVVVLGGGTFPTISPANPTLTICALAVRAARRLRGAQA
jgi:choline dehydrogenase-like flavoprotein